MARRFRNWGRTVATRPAAWLAPTSEDELVAAIRTAAGKRLRVVGGAHSWSAIAAPEDVAITLDRLAGVVAIAPDRTTVTVRAGTRLRALNEHLAGEGLALPIVGSIAEQSIAGVIATGTHGSSLVHGNLASLVRRLRLFDGRGTAIELAAEDPRLDGARVHLGALGVVTEVTLAIGPAFHLAETIADVPIDDLPAALPAIAASAEYVKVWWMPHTPRAYVFRYERTAEPTSTRPSPVRQRWVDEKVMHTLVFPLALRLGRIPRVTPAVSRIVARGFKRPRRVGPSTLMLSTPMPARHRETEAAMPLAIAGEAVERTRRAIERERLTVNMPIEVRFVRGDHGWMSPAAGGDTCQLGAYCQGSRTDAFFTAFWREMRELGARPHWGKELDHTADEVRALWPDTPKFLALRDQLDPGRVYASAFHTRTLGP